MHSPSKLHSLTHLCPWQMHSACLLLSFARGAAKVRCYKTTCGYSGKNTALGLHQGPRIEGQQVKAQVQKGVSLAEHKRVLTKRTQQRPGSENINRRRRANRGEGHPQAAQYGE